MPEERVSYAYGDTAIARQRLMLLAKVFAPCTRRLLASLPSVAPCVVLDLGCGPGETTRLLHERFPEARAIGLDSSARLVDAARARQPAAISFQVADVTRALLARWSADLIYARFLLAHLPQATELVSCGGRALRPGGVLVLEEVERILTADPAFERYLETATLPLRARGTELFIGPQLASMDPSTGADMATSLCTLQPDSRDAARLFALNLRTLRNDPAVASAYSKRELDRLARELETRAADCDGASIVWEMRQVTITRRTAF